MSSLKPTAIVDLMYNNDAFSQWLGINRILEEQGKSVLSMVVRPEMCNGFHIAHGGITYSLADSALAFASNSHGQKAVSIETSISHLKSVMAGDTLTATAIEMSCSYKIGFYQVEVKNQKEERVAMFKGTVYRKSETWSMAD